MVQEVLFDDADFLREIVERVLQEVLEAGMTEHVGAAPYERTDARKGHRNGHKPRTLRTRVGTLNLLVPQDSEGPSQLVCSLATRETRRRSFWH
jgi:transposase-like protein